MTGVLDRIGTGTPDWVMCAGCRTMVYGRRLSRNLLVCPDCGAGEPPAPTNRRAEPAWARRKAASLAPPGPTIDGNGGQVTGNLD